MTLPSNPTTFVQPSVARVTRCSLGGSMHRSFMTRLGSTSIEGSIQMTITKVIESTKFQFVSIC